MLLWPGLIINDKFFHLAKHTEKLPTCQYKLGCENEPSNTNGKFCIFHDEEHYAEHEEEAVTRFEYKVKNSINQNEPLKCTGYYLPAINFAKLLEWKTFAQPVDFNEATFYKEANFAGAVFDREAIFSEAHFNGEANFAGAFFNRKADFDGAVFDREASFYGTKFNGEAYFFAFFNRKANFSYAVFNRQGNFFNAHFNGDADFSRAHFKEAEFREVDFKEEVVFSNVEFPSTDKQYLFDWYYIIPEEGRFRLDEFRIPGLELSKNNLSFEMSDDSKTIKIYWQEGTAPISSLHYTFELNEEKKYAALMPALKNNKDNRIPSTLIAERRSDNSIEIYNKDVVHIPIEFYYSTFRKRVKFVGSPKKPLELGFVSFVGVDMTNMEFANVRWHTKREKLFKIIDIVTRNVIIDEEHLAKNNSNYEEVSRIYNQLRKNYETRLLFNEASNFFIGEMEAIRKSLLGKRGGKLKSVPYLIYKWLALYGESISLPLVIWTPILIGLFIVARIALGACSIPSQETCSIFDKSVDSFAAYFQFPRSSAISTIVANNLDVIERIVSVPVLGTAFVALRRKFERAK